MSYIKGENRGQITLFPASIEEYICEDSYVRVIDAFVEKLDLESMGVQRHRPAKEGRPGYDPRDMIKLYIYGYFNKIRSSRRLQTECGRNVELMWLLGKIVPDFRCIADFRKENAKAIKLVFREFVKLCDKLELLGKADIVIDGSKFKAVNSKERNYTKGKLSDRILWIDEKIASYLAELDENDEREKPIEEKSKEEIEAAIADLERRKALYESYLKEMEDENKTQKSLTDPEAKLMKNNGKMDVCFNVQTAVDSKNHIVVNFDVTDSCNDMGQLEPMAKSAKEVLGIDTIELTADKGYRNHSDILSCLLNGDIPNVHTFKGKNEYTFIIRYEEREISAKMLASKKREDIEACLSAGRIPDVLKGKIELKQAENKENNYALPNEIIEGEFFTRDIESNTVMCPMGQTLRQKSCNSGKKRYCNKKACRECPKPCTKSKYKTVDFKENQIVIKRRSNNKNDNKNSGKPIKTKTKYLTIHFIPDKEKLRKRKSIVEHPFGTIKHWCDGSYLLMKGKEKATADLAFSFLSYGLKRAINILGVKNILETI